MRFVDQTFFFSIFFLILCFCTTILGFCKVHIVFIIRANPAFTLYWSQILDRKYLFHGTDEKLFCESDDLKSLTVVFSISQF